jgi:hypothetical protein
MADKPEFLQLETSDDVTSVRDRLSFSRGKRVLLIWPEEGTTLTRKLDLVLVQREAARLAIKLALVTHDADVIQHAEDLGISTFETIGASERGRWRRGRAKVFTTRFHRPKDELEPEDLMPVASRVRSEDSAGSRVRRVIARVIVLALLIGVTLAVAYLLVPNATVTVQPAQEEAQVQAAITADPQATDISVENRLIPAIIVRVPIQDTGTIPTSGKQQLAAIPATGSVVFINQTNASVPIPAGTNVTTSAGQPVVFTTSQDATVPAGVGQQMEVPVQAAPDSAGDASNVQPGMINTVATALASKVTVRNISATFGGENRTLNAVSQDDKDRLLGTLRQQLQSKAYVEMLPRLTATQFLIPETIHISEERADWETFSAQPGDVADTLTLTMQVVVEASAIDEQFAQQIAFAQMATQIPRGRTIRPETIHYDCCSVQNFDAQTGQITFTINGSGAVVAQVDTGMLQDRLAGRTPDEAINYLVNAVDLMPGTTPQITLSPDWLGRLPLLPMRITVRVQDGTS